MFGTLKKRISRTWNRASELVTGVGPTPAKQFRNAIVDGDEEKAISLYTTSKEGEKTLYEELHPSMPFPSRKNGTGETPLYLASKHALEKLVIMLLERGGDPGVTNARQETCVHVVCSQSDCAELRASIIDLFMEWNQRFERGEITEKVSVNKVDIDGNTAIHYAATKGLLSCVERLATNGAILSIVNKSNSTCCELADANGHKDLAMILELALVFQPIDYDLEQFNRASGADFRERPGQLVLDTHSLSTAGLTSFIEDAVGKVSMTLDWTQARKFRPRAEALLNSYAWDVPRLKRDLMEDGQKVLTAAKMEAVSQKIQPTVVSGVEKSSTTLPPLPPVDGKEESTQTTVLPPPPPSEDAVVPTSPETSSTALVLAENLSEIAGAPDSTLSRDLGDEKAVKEGGSDRAAVIPPAAPQSGIKPETVKEEPAICSICCEEMLPEMDTTYFIKNHVADQDRHCLSCLSGHSFCHGCWSGHLTVQVAENGQGFMPCPGYKCGEILDLQWAPILLKSQDQVKRLLQQRVRHVVDCAGLKYCPVEGCGLIVHIPKTTSSDPTASSMPQSPGTEATATISNSIPFVGMCDNNHLFCVSCTQVAHTPCSCTQYPKWIQLVQQETKAVETTSKDGVATGDEIANAMWVAANTKRCPRCATAIEKDEGCNHMSCRKCRKEFCWICMQDWSLHSDTTGGYFQCNRFQEAARNSEGSGNGEVWTEDRGNAHAETMRLRERNRKMARFIHHFTRFQAHGESFKMESRMSQDTFQRIEDGLKRSLNGHLKWLPGPVVPNPMGLAGSKDRGAQSAAASTGSSVGLKEAAVSPLEAAAQVLAEGSAAASALIADISQMTDANIIEQHCLKPSPYLQFLGDGFHELLKCRQFLQWTYPYAFFEFEESDDNDYGGSRPRRNTWHRSRAHDHRTSFEFLQAELETTVETLSDVCARRRLRASQQQIIQATRTAKQKRVEFEEVLLSYATAKQQYLMQTPSSTAPSSRASSTHRSGTRHSRLRTVGTHNSTRSRRNQRSTTEGGHHTTDEMNEIVTLLRDLENAANFSTNHNDAALANTAGNTPPRPRGSATGSESHRRRTAQNRFRPPREEGEGSSVVDSSESNEEEDREDFFALRSRQGRRTAPDATRGDMEEEDEELDAAALDFLRLIAQGGHPESGSAGSTGTGREASLDGIAAGPGLGHLSDARLTRLARRAEEEEALNRAILLSLREGPALDSSGRVRGPSAANIEILQNMGFTAEQAENALRESGDDVESAANRLLGVDTYDPFL